MSRDWASDVHEMHAKYGFHETAAKLSPTQRDELLVFRKKFLDEEMRELGDAIAAGDPEETVDALVDLVVVAIGTLDIFDVDAHRAWDAVHEANMSKERGVKASRPNPHGFPDLVKPPGWVAPSHVGNHGTVPSFKDENPSDAVDFGSDLE